MKKKFAVSLTLHALGVFLVAFGSLMLATSLNRTLAEEEREEYLERAAATGIAWLIFLAIGVIVIITVALNLSGTIATGKWAVIRLTATLLSVPANILLAYSLNEFLTAMSLGFEPIVLTVSGIISLAGGLGLSWPLLRLILEILSLCSAALSNIETRNELCELYRGLKALFAKSSARGTDLGSSNLAARGESSPGTTSSAPGGNDDGGNPTSNPNNTAE